MLGRWEKEGKVMVSRWEEDVRKMGERWEGDGKHCCRFSGPRPQRKDFFKVNRRLRVGSRVGRHFPLRKFQHSATGTRLS